MSENPLNIEWIEAAAIEDNPKAVKRPAIQPGLFESLKALLFNGFKRAESVVEKPEAEEHIPPQRVRFGVSVRVDTIDFDSLEPFELDPDVYFKVGGEHLINTEYVKGVVRYHQGDELHEKEFVFPASNPEPSKDSTPYKNILALKPA